MAVLLRSRFLKAIINNNMACVGIDVNQKRNIYGKILRESLNVPPRKPPFDYEKKVFFFWYTLWDTTSVRLDDNSKVIVIDGPVASGKTKLAKELAEDLDMKHFPEVTMDMEYINPYGYDLRQLDHLLPLNAKSYDHTNFCKEPVHVNCGGFQMSMYYFRTLQYLEALSHLFNTGQGVILERSPFSDFVFLESMFQCKFVSPGVKSVYYQAKSEVMQELLRPHLAIYLDMPVNTVKDRIKARDYPHERNSKALTDEFLQTMEENYKQKYLKEISKHAELLVYDWTNPGDTEVIIEDIERIDFDHYDTRSPKMQDWDFIKEQALNDTRRYYTNNRHDVLAYFNIPRFDVPELLISGQDDLVRDQVYSTAPGMKYDKGYNKEAGDTGILTKTSVWKQSHHWTYNS